MLSYFLRRLFSLSGVVVLIALFSFLLIHLVPGNPAMYMLGDLYTEERAAIVEKSLGLDKPLHIQFYNWIKDIVLRGHLGMSAYLKQPVEDLLMTRVPVTFGIATIALMIGVIIGVPGGIIAAIWHGSWIDRLTTGISVSGISVPSFWIGMYLIVIFAVQLRWFPSGGYVALQQSVIGWLKHMFLPSFTLGIQSAALLMRLTRSSALDVLRQDYIRTAWSKGLPSYKVILVHVLRNCLVPIVTVLGLTYGILLGGALVTERVFSLPGVGRLVVSAIQQRDYQIVQGVLLFSGVVYALINLITDLLYGMIDPRIRYN